MSNTEAVRSSPTRQSELADRLAEDAATTQFSDKALASWTVIDTRQFNCAHAETNAG